MKQGYCTVNYLQFCSDISEVELCGQKLHVYTQTHFFVCGFRCATGVNVVQLSNSRYCVFVYETKETDYEHVQFWKHCVMKCGAKTVQLFLKFLLFIYLFIYLFICLLQMIGVVIS
jgi:hypothetical protein